MAFLGLDVIAIKLLSRQLDTQSKEIESMAKELSSALEGTAWIGPDQQKFLEEWNSTHRPNLIRGHVLLATTSRLANENAVAQERKSSGS